MTYVTKIRRSTYERWTKLGKHGSTRPSDQIVGSELYANLRTALKEFLSTIGLGVVIATGCLDLTERDKAWEDLKVYEKARLMSTTLHALLPGATKLKDESDEGHMYEYDEESQKFMSKKTAGYSVWLDLMPHTRVGTRRLLEVVHRQNGNVFTIMDDFRNEKIYFGSKGMDRGGLMYNGLLLALTKAGGSYRRRSAEEFLLVDDRKVYNGRKMTVAQWIEELCESIGTQGYTGRYKDDFHAIDYHTRVAIVQAYIYVTSLNVDMSTQSKDVPQTIRFMNAAAERMLALTTEEIDARHTRNAAETTRLAVGGDLPHVPATWLYVFVCVQFQLSLFEVRLRAEDKPRFGKGEGHCSLKAIKEYYLPFCKEIKDEAGVKRFIKDNGRWETHFSAGAWNSLITQSLYLTWYSEQLVQVFGSESPPPAILPSTLMTREQLRYMKVYLPFKTNAPKALNSYLTPTDHFKSRMATSNLKNYVIRFMNAFFAGMPSEVIRVSEDGDMLRRCDGVFVTDQMKDWDSIHHGVAGLSGIMMSGGLHGIGSLRVRLKSTINPAEWMANSEFAGARDGMKPWGIFDPTKSKFNSDFEASLQRMFDAQNVTATMEGGYVIVILAYEHAHLFALEDKVVHCCVDTGQSADVSSYAKALVESFSRKTEGQDYTRNVYDVNMARGQGARGITVLDNVTNDEDSKSIERLVLTIPPGHIKNLQKLWLKNDYDTRPTFFDWLSTAPMSVKYLQKLPEVQQRAQKLSLPFTHPDTGLRETPRGSDDLKGPSVYYEAEGWTPILRELDISTETLIGNVIDTSKIATIGMGGDKLAANQAMFDSLLPLKMKTTASTSGLTMAIVEAFVKWCRKDKRLKKMICDTVDVAYHWVREMAGNTLNDLMPRLFGPYAEMAFLRLFAKRQFNQVASREGYERQTYGVESLDVALVRLVMSSLMTLQTAEQAYRGSHVPRPRSGLSTYDMKDAEAEAIRKGPVRERVLITPSRRNYAEIISGTGIIPSTVAGVGGLAISVATALDVQTLMAVKADTQSKFRTFFECLQPLAPFRHEVGAGVMANDVQRSTTFANAVTEWFAMIASHPSGGTDFRHNPLSGLEVGKVVNPGIGCGSLSHLQESGMVDDIKKLTRQAAVMAVAREVAQRNEGIGEDNVVKINEAGELITGIPTLARQVLAIQSKLEAMRPGQMGQILKVATGMYTLYVGTLRNFDSPQRSIIKRLVFVDTNVRFSSRLMRGSGKLHNLRIHTMARQVAKGRKLQEPVVYAPIKEHVSV
jgi:hypothetical protein